MFKSILKKRKKRTGGDGANAKEDAELLEFLARDY
jgi:hypothetical protein